MGLAKSANDNGVGAALKVATDAFRDSTEPLAFDEHVLFIDDEAPVRRAFARVVKRRGITVDLAANADEAAELARKNQYGIIISDLRMPGEDGLSVIGKLHRIQPTAAFMLITGVEELELPKDAPEAGLISQVMFKPWNTNELLIALQRGVERHREQQESAKDGVEQKIQTKHRSALILAAETEHANLIREMLQQEPEALHRIAHTRSLSDAREFLGAVEFGAVIIDLDLPNNQGLAAVSELHELYPWMAIIVVGSTKDAERSAQATQSGAHSHILREELHSATLSSMLLSAISRSRAQEKLSDLMNVDHVTGLANQISLRQQLQEKLDTAARQQHRVALLVIDIDRFKALNEEHGQATGDKLLRTVGERLQSSVHENDVVARLHSDRFAVVSSGNISQESIRTLARTLIQHINAPLRYDGRDIVLTSSIGAALAPPTEPEPDHLIRHAEAALAQAQYSGRNRYRIHQADMSQKASKQLSLEGELGRALEQQEFRIYYQPILEVASGRTVGAEALIRWLHPERGLIAPGAFIPPLEETGLIVSAGEWVLETACHDCLMWPEMDGTKLSVAVNISAVQFQEEAMQGVIGRILDSSGLTASRLEIEITESALLENSNATRTSLTEIKGLGVAISLDDFGTGYSSLSYLKRYPIDTLKIDRTFVRDITTDSDDAAIAVAIIALGKALHLDLVAEGVTSTEQLNFLRSHGCQRYQGFLRSRPLPAEQFPEWLMENRLQQRKAS